MESKVKGGQRKFVKLNESMKFFENIRKGFRSFLKGVKFLKRSIKDVLIEASFLMFSEASTNCKWWMFGKKFNKAP